MSDYREERKPLAKEDYVEPNCVLCEQPYGAEPETKSVPVQRIIEKMDAYMAKRDYAGAERHLLYWLEEAKLGRDERGQLMLYGELVGHYRKTGEKEKAFANGEAVLALIEKAGFADTISAATAYVNVATACSAFGENERALELFRKAKAIYESSAYVRPELYGGLCNNMALTCAGLGLFDEAFACYEKAMETMAKVPGGALEQAITCLNMADAVELRDGAEAGEKEIEGLLARAKELLDDGEAPRDGYYAFVCEKCAPSFGYHGWFRAANELKKRAEEIYARA